jgi:broad specificity phosphatase PhoE
MHQGDDQETGTPGSRYLFLMRHGQVAEEWRGRIYGSLDVPLSETGRREARRLAELLACVRLSLVVSSGLERTEFGAALLRSGRGLARQDDAALREIDRGSWAGLLLSELERAQPGAWERWHRAPRTSAPPGGESLLDLERRVLPSLDRWVHRAPGPALAVVAHGWVLRVAVCTALGLPLERAPALDLRTGELVVIECRRGAFSPGEIRLRGFALDRLPIEFA